MSHQIVSCGAAGAAGVDAARRVARDDALRAALWTGVTTAEAVR
jgi:hypothetical protein